MNEKRLKMIYTLIVPSTTQWLPRYYTILKLIEESITLDASCGTGDTTIELKKRGEKVIEQHYSVLKECLKKEKSAGLIPEDEVRLC